MHVVYRAILHSQAVRTVQIYTHSSEGGGHAPKNCLPTTIRHQMTHTRQLVPLSFLRMSLAYSLEI